MTEEQLLAAWSRLRQARGRRATLIDLYRLAAEPRGLAPQQLPLEERLRLARAAMPLVWPGFEVTPESSRNEVLEVVDYDPAWPERYEKWRGRIGGALGPVARRIEHVGSTAVPGLAAKPVVDIQVSVGDLLDEEGYVPALAGIGLQLRSRDELHRYFRPFAGRPREVHVHVCRPGSAWEREHLLFRDHLRARPDACRAYARAKREAMRVWSDDRWAYTDAKAEAVLDILEAAEAWAAASGWRV